MLHQVSHLFRIGCSIRTYTRIYFFVLPNDLILDAKIPGADLKRPIYKHFKNRVYIFFFEATASWQVAEMKDLGRPRAVLYCQDDVRWPQLIGKTFKVKSITKN